MTPKLFLTLPDYTPALLRADALAGLTVAMVALPLSIAIAIASGADPATGVTTAIVGGFLISLLGGSRVQIGGPTGAFIVVVFGIIARHGHDGLVLATLMAGLILMLAAFFKAGSLVRHIPEAVIDGFTIGIAVIIATSQLRDLLGLSIAEMPGEFLHKVAALWQARDSFAPWAFGVGLATMAMIAGLRAAAPRYPGLIVAVGLGSAAVAVWTLPVDTLHSRYGALPASLPMPGLPDISYQRVIDLLPSALIIAFLAGVESLLSAAVADRMVGGNTRPNAEVMANGVANLGSALFGGLPATGAIARTATNVRAGGRTPMAGLFHALAILVIVLLAAPLAGYFAMPALAGLLILTAWNMSEPHKWRARMKLPLADRVLLFLTMGLTVLTDLTLAIGVGVALGLALRLRHRRQVPGPGCTPPDK